MSPARYPLRHVAATQAPFTKHTHWANEFHEKKVSTPRDSESCLLDRFRQALCTWEDTRSPQPWPLRAAGAGAPTRTKMKQKSLDFVDRRSLAAVLDCKET